MPTTVVLGAEDWARARFVRSRLWDTVQALRVTMFAPKQTLHRPWLVTLDLDAVARELPVLRALNPHRGWVPDFLAPPPAASPAGLGDELAQVGRYPLDAVAADLQRCLRSSPGARRTSLLAPLVADPADARERIVEELATAWQLLLASIWPRVEELITADIAHRGAVIARRGVAAVLDDLHPDVRRRGHELTVRHGDPVRVEVGGEGLALMPSAFSWPTAVVVHDPPWPVTLAYPARGIAEMWTEPPRPPRVLGRLLGPTRAAVLLDLAEPRTTRELASRHDLAPATVSEHLAALHDARLLHRHRLGREVRYRHTPLATQLVRASGSAG